MKPSPGTQRPGEHTELGLRIAKELGQGAVEALTQLGLIKRNYRIDSNDSFLFIPLTRRPSPDELRELIEDVGPAIIVEHSFHTAEPVPRTLREALRGNIPSQLLSSLPSSYDIVGDIAILDLAPSLSDFEDQIAKGIQQVNKTVRVVLGKAGSISGTERVLPTRHIAGENRTVTVHVESGCRFKVDLAKAYFSPRLSHEHERVVAKVEPGETVTDLFSGVGPFAIMIAKKLDEVRVNAVDSNPNAVNLIKENAVLNRVETRLTVWLGDAREVVQKNLSGRATRVIMNHPSASKQFVDVACEALKKEGGIIHYYTFAEGVNCEDRAVSELESALQDSGWRMRWLAEAHRVREVSPMTWQLAVDAPVVPAG